MKRYLIEPEFAKAREPGEETKAIYRIVDTRSRQTVPPEGEDIGTIAHACADLNEADVKHSPPIQSATDDLGASDSLPDEIVQSIAISNAHSIGSQPAILANLELSQQIFNENMRQQNAVAHQQAMNLIRLAVVAKCVSMIDSIEGNDHEAFERMAKSADKLFHDLGRGFEQPSGDALSAQAH